MSARALRLAIGMLALVGIAIAAYLTYAHYNGLKPLCLSSGGCETVQSSRYAKLAGIPVATIGLVGYLLLFGSVWLKGELGKVTGSGLGLVGFGFSAYLTYRELFTIKAICQWCVASAVIMTLLAVLTTWRVLQIETDLDGGKPRDVPHDVGGAEVGGVDGYELSLRAHSIDEGRVPYESMLARGDANVPTPPDR
jgi:uncharacterized membrane protein